MSLKLFLVAACFVTSTTSQTFIDSSPVWNFGGYTFGTGTEASSKAPVGQYVSKIEIYKGWSGLCDFGGIQVSYGTTPTPSTLAKYSESNGTVSTTLFRTITMTST